MSKDDEAERKARAESLMQEIERLTSQSHGETKKVDTHDEPTTAEDEERKPAPENPRDFIHRRMRELDKQEKEEEQS